MRRDAARALLTRGAMRPACFPLILGSLALGIACPACGPSAASSSCSGPSCSAPQGASILVADPNVCGEVAAANGMVFWVDRSPTITDSIRAVPAAGGAPKTLYAAEPDPNAAIEDLAADGVNLYFTEVGSNPASTIKSLPQAGGEPTVLLQDPSILTIIAVDGSFVYYDDDQGNLARIPVTGGTPALLSPAGFYPFTFTANASGACWVANSSDFSGVEIVCQPQGATQAKTVATATYAPTAIAMSTTQIAWADAQDNAVWTTTITGGPPTRVFPGATSNVGVLAVDATRAYWLAEPWSSNTADLSPDLSPSTLWEASLDGSSSSALASSLYPAVGSFSDAQALVQSDTALFWTDTRGLVLMAAK